MRRFAPLVAGSVVLAGAVLTAQALPRTRSVYVSAVNDQGRAVLDLAASEISVKEDGKARPVVHIAPAAGKLSIAVLVDDGGVGMNDFRIGIAGFMNRLFEQAEFALVGISEQNRTIVDYTTQNTALANGIRSLIPRNVNGGGHLVEAVLDAATVMARREVRRPVILIVTNQGREYGDLPASRAMDQVARVGAPLYVVEVLRPSGQSRAAGERYDAVAAGAQDSEQASSDRARNSILGDGPRQTGGRHEEAIATADVPGALAAMAEELAGQCLLTYETAAKLGAAAKIEVSSSRRGIKIRAPARAMDRQER